MNVWCLLIAGFAIVFVHYYSIIVHVDVDLDLHVMFIRLKEGISSAQSSMHLKKVAEGLALYFTA